MHAGSVDNELDFNFNLNFNLNGFTRHVFDI